MTPLQMRALVYVLSSSGSATKAEFLDDHEPIGNDLWSHLEGEGLIAEVDGAVRPTEAGMEVLFSSAGGAA